MKVEIIDWDNNSIVVEDVKSFNDCGDNVTIKFVINGISCEYTYAYKTFRVISAPPAYHTEKAPEDIEVVLDGSEPEEPLQYLTTVVVSDRRVGKNMGNLARVKELAKRSGRIISYTILYDDIFLDRFGSFPKGVSPNRNSGRHHQFILKSNYSIEELEIMFDRVNCPEYDWTEDTVIKDISL